MFDSLCVQLPSLRIQLPSDCRIYLWQLILLVSQLLLPLLVPPLLSLFDRGSWSMAVCGVAAARASSSFSAALLQSSESTGERLSV